MAKEPANRRLASILAAEVIDHSRLLNADEAAAAHRLTSLHRDIIEPLIARRHGRIIDLAADRLLARFYSVVDAVTCAVEWQDRVIYREVKREQDRRIRFRIGIHCGDLVTEGEEVRGDGVDIAKRLMPLAPPDGICISKDALLDVRGKFDLGWAEMGPQHLENIADPVTSYSVTRYAALPSADNVVERALDELAQAADRLVSTSLADSGYETEPDVDLDFIEKAPHEEGFAAHFAQHIKPRLAKIERARQNARAEYRTRGRLALVALAIAILAAFVLIQQTGDLTILGLFAFGVLFGGVKLYEWASKPIERFTAGRKQAIIPEVLKFVGDFRYQHGGKIPDHTLHKFDLFGHWNKQESEDLITGSYYDRRFQFAEAELSSDSGAEGSTQVFKGWLFVLQMPPGQKRTIAFERKGAIPKWLDHMLGSFKELQEVQFDDANISEKFDVYSADASEARRIITPRLIHAVKKLSDLRGASSIEFGVSGDKFLLKIATDRDLFEPDAANLPALTTEDTRRFLEELREVLAIIKVLATATDPPSDELGSDRPEPL